jgi:hypothetical protein
MSDANTAVAAAPLVAAVAPYVIAIAGVVAPALVGWGVDQLRKLTGVQLQKAASDRLDSMIEDEVGALVAAASDNLACVSVHVGSPLVAAIANKIVAVAPGVLAEAGVSPAAVAGMVHGEIGKWQAGMTSVSPPSAAAAGKAA